MLVLSAFDVAAHLSDFLPFRHLRLHSYAISFSRLSSFRPCFDPKNRFESFLFFSIAGSSYIRGTCVLALTMEAFFSTLPTLNSEYAMLFIYGLCRDYRVSTLG